MNRTYLTHRFYYDMVEGELYYRNHPQPRNNGNKAGFITGNRYKCKSVRIDGKCVQSHRVIWCLVYNEVPSEIDHIDGDPFNNRLQNLRIHPSHNQHNRVETRHLPEPLRVKLNGKNIWTETGKQVLREYHRTGVWNAKPLQ